MMKKKLFALLLTATMLCGLTACGATDNVNAGENSPTLMQDTAPTAEPTTAPTKAPTKTPITVETAAPTTEPTTAPTEAPTGTAQPITEPVSSPDEVSVPATKTIAPLPVTIDMNNLDNCTVAVSFNKGDAYVDDNGIMQLKAKVYTYDLYDMVDIALLKEGDTIILRGEEVLVNSLVRTEHGSVQINGGLDVGGYELITTENTVYFETGYSDMKSYYELGEATLRVSADFIFTDKMDLDKGAVTYYPGDFLTDEAGIFYSFAPDNTSIVIQNGQVISMERIYTP